MKHIPILMLSSAVVLISSCSVPTGPNTTQGAATGAILGGVAGGIIGHQSGRGLEGAALGAGVGGVTGAAVGNQRDARQYYGR